MPLLSITRLRIRSVWFLPKFFWYASRSLKQARNAKGNIVAKVFNEPGHIFWTCSIWEDEMSMIDYMRSGSHKKVMPALKVWCNEARTGHITIHGNSFPSPMEMAKILLSHGRLSKLNFPNDNHLKGIVKEPAFSNTG